MTHDQPLARRIVLEYLNNGPQDIVGLGGHLFGKVPAGAEYFAARVAVGALLSERLIGQTGDCYHIADHTPTEPEHKPTETIHKRQRALERKPA